MLGLILLCGLLFALFAIIAPDIAWPLFTVVLWCAAVAGAIFVLFPWALIGCDAFRRT